VPAAFAAEGVRASLDDSLGPGLITDKTEWELNPEGFGRLPPYSSSLAAKREVRMSRRLFLSLIAGATLSLASARVMAAEELNIFWAEWDPANYLQELVNDYTKETGVKVTVSTTPWSDFETKTFREFAA
jgi:hypothetical protein